MGIFIDLEHKPITIVFVGDISIVNGVITNL